MAVTNKKVPNKNCFFYHCTVFMNVIEKNDKIIKTKTMSSTSSKSYFLKPNTNFTGNASLDTERLNEIESQHELVKHLNDADTGLDLQRRQLPIFKYQQQILYALETHRVVIIVVSNLQCITQFELTQENNRYF
jgi:HrpA-like RNA helicase